MHNISRLYPTISKHSEGRTVEGNEICAYEVLTSLKLRFQAARKLKPRACGTHTPYLVRATLAGTRRRRVRSSLAAARQEVCLANSKGDSWDLD